MSPVCIILVKGVKYYISHLGPFSSSIFCFIGFFFSFLLNLILPLSNPLYNTVLHFITLPFISVPVPTFPFGLLCLLFYLGDPINSPRLSCHLLCMLMTPQASPLLTPACCIFLPFSCLSEAATCTPNEVSMPQMHRGSSLTTILLISFPSHLFLTGVLFRWIVTLFIPTSHLAFGRAFYFRFSLFTQSLDK